MVLDKGYVLGNRYEIIEKVGAGGMSIVYKARCKHLERIVAIKVLREEFIDDAEFIDRFERECKAVAKLNHPNIVNVFDVGCDGDIHYMVMEYMDGKNLKDVIYKVGSMDKKIALTILYSVAEALEYAHKNGIIHRDVKSMNVLINQEGIVKVVDFGISKVTTSSTISVTSNAIGSVHYFSPEQAKGEALTEKSDIYSLGIIIYEMFTRELPFDGESPVTVALKHITDDIPSPSSKKKGIGPGIDYMVAKATEKDPDNRYKNITEFKNDIEALIDGKDITRNHNKALKAMQQVDIKKFATTTYDVEKQIAEAEAEIKRLEEQIEEKPVAAVPLSMRAKSAFDNISNELNKIANGSYEKIDEEIKENSYKDNTKDHYKNIESLFSKLEDKDKDLDLNPDEEDEMSKIEYNEYYTEEDDKKLVLSAVVTSFFLIGFMILGVYVYVLRAAETSLVTVPDLCTMNYEEAQDMYGKKGLTINVAEYVNSEDYIKGAIIKQNVEPNKEVAKGSSIDVQVSSGALILKMPDLVGRTTSEAKQMLDRLGIKLETSTDEESKMAAGYITKTSPDYGTPLKPGQQVTAYVSIGSTEFQNVPVPHLVDLDKEEAEEKIKEEGFKLGSISYKIIENGEENIVYSQKPEAAETLDKGSEIDLVITKKASDEDIEDDNDAEDNKNQEVEKGKVPDVRNLSLEEARELIEKAGCTLGKVSERSVPRGKDKAVYSQSPIPGSRALSGVKVNLVITKLETSSNDDNEEVKEPIQTGDKKPSSEDDNKESVSADIYVKAKVPVTVNVAPAYELNKDTDYSVQIVVQNQSGLRVPYEGVHKSIDFPFSRELSVEKNSKVSVIINEKLVSEDVIE